MLYQNTSTNPFLHFSTFPKNEVKRIIAQVDPNILFSYVLSLKKSDPFLSQFTIPLTDRFLETSLESTDFAHYSDTYTSPLASLIFKLLKRKINHLTLLASKQSNKKIQSCLQKIKAITLLCPALSPAILNFFLKQTKTALNTNYNKLLCHALFVAELALYQLENHSLNTLYTSLKGVLLATASQNKTEAFLFYWKKLKDLVDLNPSLSGNCIDFITVVLPQSLTNSAFERKLLKFAICQFEKNPYLLNTLNPQVKNFLTGKLKDSINKTLQCIPNSPQTKALQALYPIALTSPTLLIDCLCLSCYRFTNPIPCLKTFLSIPKHKIPPLTQDALNSLFELLTKNISLDPHFIFSFLQRYPSFKAKINMQFILNFGKKPKFLERLLPLLQATPNAFPNITPSDIPQLFDALKKDKNYQGLALIAVYYPEFLEKAVKIIEESMPYFNPLFPSERNSFKALLRLADAFPSQYPIRKIHDLLKGMIVSGLKVKQSIGLFTKLATLAPSLTNEIYNFLDVVSKSGFFYPLSDLPSMVALSSLLELHTKTLQKKQIPFSFNPSTIKDRLLERIKYSFTYHFNVKSKYSFAYHVNAKSQAFLSHAYKNLADLALLAPSIHNEVVDFLLEQANSSKDNALHAQLALENLLFLLKNMQNRKENVLFESHIQKILKQNHINQNYSEVSIKLFYKFAKIYPKYQYDLLNFFLYPLIFNPLAPEANAHFILYALYLIKFMPKSSLTLKLLGRIFFEINNRRIGLLGEFYSNKMELHIIKALFFQKFAPTSSKEKGS